MLFLTSKHTGLHSDKLNYVRLELIVHVLPFVDSSYMFAFYRKEQKVKPPLLRSISSIENGKAAAAKDEKDMKQTDKLIEAEKSETGTVSLHNASVSECVSE